VAVASAGPYASLHLAPDNTPPLSFLTGRMPFLLPIQQRQSAEGGKNPQITGNASKCCVPVLHK